MDSVVAIFGRVLALAASSVVPASQATAEGLSAEGQDEHVYKRQGMNDICLLSLTRFY